MCTVNKNDKKTGNNHTQSKADATEAKNKVRLSLGWMLLHCLTAGVAPFFLSQRFLRTQQQEHYDATTTTRPAAQADSRPEQQSPPHQSASSSSSQQQQRPVVEKPQWNLPLPILHAHKTPPDYTYTGACLDDPYSTGSSATSSSDAATATQQTSSTTTTWSQHRVDVHMQIREGHVERLQNASAQEIQQQDDIVDHGFDGYQPAGQHLLMDIQNVDPGFLLDTPRLAGAMVEITTNSGLTLLSYHCHDLQAPMGVSCAGVLLESHVSLHTWPSAGIITLDLFTCGPASLLPLVPMLERLFAVPTQDAAIPQPSMRWLYKKRGYRDYHEIVQENIRKNAALEAGEEIMEQAQDDDEDDMTSITTTQGNSVHKPEYLDLEKYFLGWKGYHHKGVLVNQHTGQQEVQVFEMTHSNMPLSRVQNEHVAVLQTNKKLFLDNHAQSSLLGLEAYHEALCHPALAAHPHPTRVAIIGSGEGAALRECLKHATVQNVTMLEVDEELMKIAQENMKEWNDCSEFAYHDNDDNGYVSCFDDERANVLAVDAIEWFQQRFGSGVEQIDEADKFDVIIMDSFDPASPSSLSKDLYGSEEFVTALTNSLTKEGILIFQLSLSHSIDHVDVDPVFKMLQAFLASLAKHGAQSIKSYGEGHGQEWNPWDFQAVFMGDESRARWLSEASQIDFVLSERAVKTKSGGSPFHYMDGATMTTYQYPSRAQEDISCDLKPDLALCDNGKTLHSTEFELNQAMDQIRQLRLRVKAAASRNDKTTNNRDETTVSSDLASNETSDEAAEVAATCSDCESQ